VTLLQCVEVLDGVGPDATEREVAERLAAYNMLALPVCDEHKRLLGAITVDDALDRSLPAGWRQRRRPLSTAT
jgi:Mg/Co/Ni transporter MgtE